MSTLIRRPMTRRAILTMAATAAAAAPFLGQPAVAGEAPVYSNWRGRAIDGTDPVAYFTEGRDTAALLDNAEQLVFRIADQGGNNLTIRDKDKCFYKLVR